MQPSYTVTSYGLASRDVNLLRSLTTFLTSTANVNCKYTYTMSADFIFVDLDFDVGMEFWQSASALNRNHTMVAVSHQVPDIDVEIHIQKPLQTAKIRKAFEELLSYNLAVS